MTKCKIHKNIDEAKKSINKCPSYSVHARILVVLKKAEESEVRLMSKLIDVINEGLEICVIQKEKWN